MRSTRSGRLFSVLTLAVAAAALGACGATSHTSVDGSAPTTGAGSGTPTTLGSSPTSGGSGYSGGAGSSGAGTGPSAPPAISTTTVGSPTTAVSPATTVPATSSTCTSSELQADQVLLSEGTGQYYLAWSLTNISTAPCTVAGGQPGLGLDDAAGRPVVSYRVSALPGGSVTPVSVAPGHAAWFLTEEQSGSCPAGQTVSGGPFHYRVTLPGGSVAVTWAPAFLAQGTVSGYCASEALAVGDVQATEPAAP
jgi:hypothetical protein